MDQVTVERTEKYLIVKIPLKAARNGRADISPYSQKIVDEAIAEGLEDIEAGRVFGPFKSAREFKTVLKKPSGR